MKKFVSTLVIAIVSVISLQAQYKLNFVVVDTASVGEPYATVRLFMLPDTVKAVKNSTTDVDGKFSELISSKGKYRVTISSIGKKPYSNDVEISGNLDLGKIVLKVSSEQLAELDVVAQRPLVTTEIDRFIYDIKADDESKTSNIFDMLRKVPMVTVDGEDQIRVKGNSNFRIFKNGRPNSAWEKNPKEVLKSIPASMIKKIEVITEPGAKYDAEGVDGILNIVTDDEVTAKGIMGSVGGTAGIKGTTQLYGYATAQYDKVVLSATYSISNNPSSVSRSKSESSTYYKMLDQTLSRWSDNNANKALYQNVDLEASYEMDSLNLFTAEFYGWFPNSEMNNYNYTKTVDDRQQVLSSYTTHSYYPKYNWSSFGGKFDYQRLTKHKDESIIFSYKIDGSGQDQVSKNDYLDIGGDPGFNYDSYAIENNQSSFEHTFQLDWTRPFAKYHRIEMGLKYILRVNKSETNQKYIDNENPNADFDLNNHEKFNHTAQIGAVYAEYAFNHKRFGARAGVRYELAYNKVKYPLGTDKNFSNKLGDVVPTISGSYKFNDANVLRLNFAIRIRRPSIYYLNPAVRMSPNTAQVGNPDLKSARHNSLSLSYSLTKPKISLSLNASYAFANNTIMDYSYAEDNVIWTRFGNIGKMNNVGLSGYLQYRPLQSTSVMLNYQVNYNKLSRKDSDETNSGWGSSIFANVTQDLMWKIKLNVGGGYFRSGVYDFYMKRPMTSYYYNLGLSRSWLKQDRLTVRISANNPFPIWRKFS